MISLAGAEEAVRLHREVQRLNGLKGWLEKKLPGVTQVTIAGTTTGFINLPTRMLIEQVASDISLLTNDLENIT